MWVDDAIDEIPVLLYDYIRSNMEKPPKFEPIEDFQNLCNKLGLRNNLCENTIFKSKNWRRVEDEGKPEHLKIDYEELQQVSQMVNSFYKVIYYQLSKSTWTQL